MEINVTIEPEQIGQLKASIMAKQQAINQLSQNLYKSKTISQALEIDSLMMQLEDEITMLKAEIAEIQIKAN